MKNRDKTKRKEEKQRLKALKTYYRSYAIGDSVFSSKHVKCIVVAKHKLNNEYYFVVQDMYGALQLQKLVYGERIRIVNVSREGKQYDKNSNVFDTWFATLEKKHFRMLEEYYNKTHIGDQYKDKNYIFVLKKQYVGNHYFILTDQRGAYVVARLSWWYTKVRLEILSENQWGKDKELFARWIQEAKERELLRHRTKHIGG